MDSNNYTRLLQLPNEHIHAKPPNCKPLRMETFMSPPKPLQKETLMSM